MSVPLVKLQPTYTTFNNLIQYKPINVDGGLFVIYPQVLYNGIIYQYTAWGTPVGGEPPITYKTPNTDSSAVALYTLGGGGTVNVLGTALAGLAPASGVPATSSTILQAFNFLAYRSYGFVKTMGASITANGNVPLTGGVLSASSDITLATPVVNIPQAKSFNVTAVLSVTTADASGCTFAIGGANVTATSTPIVIGASVTGLQVMVTGLVVPLAASPNVAIVASGFSGTVSYASGSLIITQV